MRRLRWSMGRQLFVVCLHYAWKVRIQKGEGFFVGKITET